MHYPDSRWRPRCQGKSRDDVSGRISHNCTAAKLSSFHAGFKTGIHLKKHRFINIARSHCSIFINHKKIIFKNKLYRILYYLIVVFIFFV